MISNCPDRTDPAAPGHLFPGEPLDRPGRRRRRAGPRHTRGDAGSVELHERHLGTGAGMHISVWGGKRTVRVELVDDDGEVRQIEAADLRALVQLLGPAVLLLGPVPAHTGRQRRRPSRGPLPAVRRPGQNCLSIRIGGHTPGRKFIGSCGGNTLGRTA